MKSLRKSSVAIAFATFAGSASASNWGEAIWGQSTWGSLPDVQIADVPIPAWAIVALAVCLVFMLRKSRAAKAGSLAILLAVFILLGVQHGSTYAQLLLPHVFQNGTVIDANKVNANFEFLRSAIQAGTPGPPGPQGPQGPQGPEGPAGLLTAVAVCVNSSSTNGDCSCNAGKYVIPKQITNSSCTVRTDTGVGCTALGVSTKYGSCCLCRP